ncbi:MAG: LptF/LptG family permease, partial [Candidatus Rokubacteria bacterium]|nr:LptF/LptG family permease [Candidatus Rokubacteria bacterium]
MRLPLLAVLDRYIVRELVSPFVLGTSLFTFFLLIDRLYHLTDLVITKGVPFHLVLQLLAFMLPQFLAHTFPMALLVAVLLAGGRLAGDLEIVACKAAGVSLFRLFRPVFLVGIAMTVITASFTLVLSPLANQEFQRQLFTILQTRAASGLKERVFNTTFGDIVIYVEEVSASQVGLRGLVVSDERDPKLSRIVTAHDGRLLSDPATRKITLRMINGGVSEADVTPADPPKGLTTEEMAVGGGAAGAKRYRYSAFAIYDMNLTVESPLKSAAKGQDKPEKDLGLRELVRKIHETKDDPMGVAAMRAELQKRFAFPVASFVFALMGFPLAVRSHRGGRSVALVATLVILVSYYVIITSLEGAALRGRLPIWLAIWLPNMLFGSMGITLLIVTAREWRAPQMGFFWRLLNTLWEAMPRRRARRDERFTTTARESTHIVDRYLLRQYVSFVGIGLAVATALFVMVDLLQTLDRFLRIKPPLIYIAEHFVYRIPEALMEGLPIIMLVATIFLFLTLTRFHELTALKAAGVSLYRVAAPILAAGLLVAVAAAIFQETALPVLNERGEEVDRVKIRGQLPRHLQSRTRLWLRSSDTRFYRVELLNPGTDDMFGVTVLEITPDFHLTTRLDARPARWTAAGCELREGAYRQISPTGGVTSVPFDRTALALDETIDDFTQLQKPITAMSYRELSDYVSRLEGAGFQVKKYLVDLYSKLSSPLKNLIMVLVAIPFALQSPRGGRLYG